MHAEEDLSFKRGDVGSAGGASSIKALSYLRLLAVLGRAYSPVWTKISHEQGDAI